MVPSPMADAPVFARTAHGRPARTRTHGPGRSGPHRRWRRRGRRAQVAAVATILGLLLVVTFIANYLQTTLPNQMSIYDLDHDLQVENQLGRFQALLEAVSVQGDVGAQVSQPVTLGSQGLPPFADADSGTVGPLNGSNYTLSYQLDGPSFFAPPSTGKTGGAYPAACTYASGTRVTMTCTARASPVYNFTTTPASGFLVNINAGGSPQLNFSTNGTAATPEKISIGSAGAASTMTVYVYGSNDTISLFFGVATTVDLIEFGTNDTVSITANVTGSTIDMLSAGYNDAISIVDGIGLTLNAYVDGWADTTTMTATAAKASAATAVTVYYSGFTSSTLLCPNDNLAATDSVAGSNTVGTYVAYYNVTKTFTPTAVTHWTQHAVVNKPSAAGCPLFNTVTVFSPTAARFAGFNVHLLNTYAPVADIGFDAGAVVIAQPGGVPQIVDAPGVNVVESTSGAVTSVSLWFPVFIGKGGAEAGVQSAILSARLVSLSAFALTPTSTYGVANNTNIELNVTTPFAAGWWSYYNATYPSSWVSCTGHGCYTFYSGLGDFGTISLSIPTGTLLNYFSVDVATFSFVPS
jgi:hypothetical protein